MRAAERAWDTRPVPPGEGEFVEEPGDAVVAGGDSEGWRGGCPTRSSRRGSSGSPPAGNPRPGRRSKPQRSADLGETGCQVNTVLVQNTALGHTHGDIARMFMVCSL